MKDEPEKFMANWYKIKVTKSVYQYYLMPLNGEKLWRRTPYDKFLPPRYRRMSGRPKKQHNNELYEARRKNHSKTSKKGMKMKCSKCGQEGHNKKTCRGPPNVSN